MNTSKIPLRVIASRRLLILVSLAFLTIVQAPVEARKRQEILNKPASFSGLVFCNHTDRTIDVAVTWWDRNNWRSRGWYSVAPGRCRERVDLGNYQGTAYIYGQPRGASWREGDALFCVNTIYAFNILYSDKVGCNGSHEERVSMYRMSLQNGDNTFDFRD